MKAIKSVPVTLDRVRHLLYDLNALVDLGEELELNLMTREGWAELVGETVAEKWTPAEPSFKKVRAIIWAGLRHEDETLTIRQVGAMLDPAALGPVITAYQEAFVRQDVTEDANPIEAAAA